MKIQILIHFFVVISIFSSVARAEGKKGEGGWFREKIKERIIKKLQDMPPPVPNAEVGKKIEKPGDYIFSVKQGELTRYYRIHVPPQYNPKNPTPLLIALHGGGGDMTIQATDEFYKQISKSDQNGHIAAFPNGYSKFKSGKLATWNAGACCGGARDSHIEDVAFIKEVVKNLSGQLNIDSKKIYSTGMSNGGLMSYRLACEMSDVFAGIASVAGTDNTLECTPQRAISVLHIHAKNDDHVLFNGGTGPKSEDLDKVTQFKSVAETITKWVKFDGCEPIPKRTLEKPGAYCESYDKCRDGVTVRLCVTETGGHSWPGGKKPRAGVGGEPSTAISANDVMWDFFNGKK